MLKSSIFYSPIFIFLFFLLFFANTSRVHLSTDTIVQTYLPISIIRGHGFNLDKIYPQSEKDLPTDPARKGPPYYIIFENNHYFSAFPIFSSVLAVPIYLPAVLIKEITLDNLDTNKNLIWSLGKISAATFSAISVLFVYLCTKLLLDKNKSRMLAVIYALGTSTLSITSQSLWQHAASQMFLSATAYFLILGQKKRQLLAACGLFLGLATISRFANVFITTVFLLYFLLYGRRSIVNFLIMALPPAIFLAWYQITYPGNLFFFHYEAIGEIAKINSTPLKAFAGLLIAPSKGLLIYSPIFTFSLLGTFIAFKKSLKIFMFFSLLVLSYTIFIASWSDWHGGWSYGPRMLVDITPFLTLLLFPVIKERKIWNSKVFKSLFTLAAFFSIFVHFLGSTLADFSWYQVQTMYLPLEIGRRADFLWNWRYPEIYYFYLGAGGFFGIIYIFFLEITHIVINMTKGFAVIILLLLIFLQIKNYSKNKKSTTKFKLYS